MIKLSDSFYELQFVKQVFNDSNKVPELNVFALYDEGIELTLPEGAIVHGVSSRTGQTMIWTSDDNRIMGLHVHAKFNTNIMHDLIIVKLYENGKIDDVIKARLIEDIYDQERPLMRHTLLKVIHSFLQPYNRQESIKIDS